MNMRAVQILVKGHEQDARNKKKESTVSLFFLKLKFKAVLANSS